MYGFKAENENEITQIDSSYSNYEVVRSGRSVGTSGGIEFDSGDILFFRPVTNGNHVGRGRISDASRSFLYVSGGDGSWTWRNKPAAVNWQGLDYVVVRPSTLIPETLPDWGLKVNDSLGGTVYDSRRNYLKIVGVQRVGPSGGQVLINLPPPPSGKRYYVCALPFYFTRATRSQYGDEDYFGYTAGFDSETTLKIRKNQNVYPWEGVINTPPRNWDIGSDHLPFFIIAEF